MKRPTPKTASSETSSASEPLKITNVAPPTNEDVISKSRVDGSSLDLQPAELLERVLKKIIETSEGWGPGLGLNADPGDKFTFTIGQETFSPIPYHTFVVGPFMAQLTLRKGEDLAMLAKRAYLYLAVVFEADFEIKKNQFWKRVAEAGENPVKNKGSKA